MKKGKGGYLLVWTPGHPRGGDGYVPEHILVAEGAMGHYLRPSAPIHHVNRVKTDNSNGNLVVCEDDAYHRLLHMRQDALDACGHADWRKCGYCSQYDDPSRMVVHCKSKVVPQMCHRTCRINYQRAYRAARAA